MIPIIRPDWPAPPQVFACTTTRMGGVSQADFAQLNLGDHVGDAAAAVAENRRIVQAELDLPSPPVWLQQIHGTEVVELPCPQTPISADASWTAHSNTVCAVLTADCLPVLICSRDGKKVAAAHAGWRGLLAGIIEQTLSAGQFQADNTLIWLGPAIGPQMFEVGEEVREAFIAAQKHSATAFVASKPGHWLADLYQLARLRLRASGFTQVSGGDFCTWQDARFFSYRQNPQTGRMVSLIYTQGVSESNLN
ncbi:peptidoglycan editing factor PgeF [Candidatus Venteria ishoeyi]|uniref:peptidoglycan editing factor PgeF n=1 Tax=Candidatus Venteria ishoeyi TaxID=1899563 RepID=UPI0025A4DE38|nr:peptidoglycan editing factor PgeF [Candidatus Venteria ishoeyi]MDM8547486.1 peptidoglycan editing factor PgeF [Candidatus Venteria ishoeyi]